MSDQEDLDRLRYLQLKKKKALATGTATVDPSFSENLVSDAKDIGKGLLETGKALVKAPFQAPMTIGKTALELSKGTPISETSLGNEASSLVSLVKNAPGAIAKRTGEIVSHPLDSLYNRPISTALDVASVVPILTGAGRAIRGSRVVTSAANAIKDAEIAGKLENAGVRALETFTSTPEKAIKRRLARPNEVRTAISQGAEEAPFVPVADDLAKSVNTLGQDARKSAVIADEALSKSKYLNDRAIPRDELLSVVKKEKSRLSTQGRIVGKSKQAAAERLDQLAEDISKLRGETVSEANVKKIIKSLDPDINWGAPENAPANLALERVRYRFDAKLKEGNPEYRNLIAESARKTKVYKRAERGFALEKQVGGSLEPTDATINKLKSIGKTRMPIVERRLKDVSRETGVDFVERSKDIDAALNFKGGSPNGSRKAFGFGAIGSAAGGMVGGYPGAAIGGSMGTLLGLLTDTRGRVMAGSVIDAYKRSGKIGELLKLAESDPRLRALVNASQSPRARNVSMGWIGSRISSEDTR